MRILFLFLVAIGFAGSTPAFAQLRPMVYADVTVDATPQETYDDWTSGSVIESFFAAEATIEAIPGGAYKICMLPEEDAPAGACGNDQGVILATEPGAMLSFTWAMPPYMPEIRPHMTVVQIFFEPMGDEKTRLRLFHTGFGVSEAWDEGHDYFEKAWPGVLALYDDYRAGLSAQP